MTDRLDEQIWLSVPFAEKDEAKALKAKWCPVRKLWWTSLRNLDANLALAKWLPEGGLKERCLTAQRWLAEHNDDVVEAAIGREYGERPAKGKADYSFKTLPLQVIASSPRTRIGGSKL